jgi:hypothetical protein
MLTWISKTILVNCYCLKFKDILMPRSSLYKFLQIRRINYLLPLLAAIIFCACSKEVAKPDQTIVGKWAWAYSHSSQGDGSFPINDTAHFFNIEFFPTDSFSNQSGSIGGPSDGTYQIQYLDDFKVLILNAAGYPSDTMRLSLSTDSLVLTETPSGYSSRQGESWYNHFYKLSKP